ncbi:hypothetical protein CMI42_06480 [Candidatus Pacearchaeota archaeon]|nr:hypothetical protein [Candidatus Pacearchaeota archaeon]|tara:strand:- start:1109 stop:1717 length:609 start_codon:yes stop_codon:yes gene_type:complete
MKKLYNLLVEEIERRDLDRSLTDLSFDLPGTWDGKYSVLNGKFENIYSDTGNLLSYLLEVQLGEEFNHLKEAHIKNDAGRLTQLSFEEDALIEGLVVGVGTDNPDSPNEWNDRKRMDMVWFTLDIDKVYFERNYQEHEEYGLVCSDNQRDLIKKLGEEFKSGESCGDPKDPKTWENINLEGVVRMMVDIWQGPKMDVVKRES